MHAAVLAGRWSGLWEMGVLAAVSPCSRARVVDVRVWTWTVGVRDSDYVGVLSVLACIAGQCSPDDPAFKSLARCADGRLRTRNFEDHCGVAETEARENDCPTPYRGAPLPCP